MSDRQNMSDLGRRWESDAAVPLLQLIDPSVAPAGYRHAMYALGVVLGRAFAEREAVQGKNVLTISTVEDADYLSRGFADAVENEGANVVFACIWVERSKLPLDEEPDVAQILAEFIEPIPERVDHFVAMKSVISGSCVVRSAILRLLDQAKPENIHIVAPVVLAGAQQRLAKGFPEQIAERFRYWILAEDQVSLSDGTVVPGVGGNVYKRLGLGDQAAKNKVMPDYVLERMAARRIPKPAPPEPQGTFGP